MSTPVKTDTDIQAIEHLDFAVRCDFELVLDLSVFVLTLHKCRKAAKWMAVFPCCGYQSMACQHHRHSILASECSGCGRIYDSVAALKWVRI